MNIINFILENKNINANTDDIHAQKTPKTVDDILGGRKIQPKADIFLIINGQTIGISIKSSPASIQVQITNIDRFKRICEYNNLEFSSTLYIALCKFCG